MLSLRLIPGLLLVTSSTLLGQARAPTDSLRAKAREELGESGITFSDESFLKYAAAGDSGTVDLFLRAGININSKNGKGETALVLASRAGHTRLASSLLGKGADPAPMIPALKVQNSDRTNLFQALFQLTGVFITLIGVVFAHLYNKRTKRLQELETIEKMLPHLGEDKQQRQTAALVAISHLATPELAGRFATVYPGLGSTLACIELLRSRSLKDTHVLKTALPQLLLSSGKNGDAEAVEMLLTNLGGEFGPKSMVDHQDGSGRTTLMWAARNGHDRIVSRLLQHKADWAISDNGGETALHLAAKHGQIEAVRVLIAKENFYSESSRKDYIGTRDRKGRSALDQAKTTNNHALISLLTENAEGSLDQSRALSPGGPSQQSDI